MTPTILKTWIKCRVCSKRRKVPNGSDQHRDSTCYPCGVSVREQQLRETHEAKKREAAAAIQNEMNALMEQFEAVNCFADTLKRRERVTFRMSDGDGVMVYVSRGTAPGKASVTVRISGLPPASALALVKSVEALRAGEGTDITNLRELQKLNLVELVKKTGNAIDITYVERAMRTIDALFGR